MSNSDKVVIITQEAKDYFFSHWSNALLHNETGEVIKKFCRMIGTKPETSYSEIKQLIKDYQDSH